MSTPNCTLDTRKISSQVPISSQRYSSDNELISTQTTITSSCNQSLDTSENSLASSDQVTATSPRKRRTPSPTKLIPGISTGRLIQLQARDTGEIYKMNEDTLSKTSDLFKYKLFCETKRPISPDSKGKGREPEDPTSSSQAQMISSQSTTNGVSSTQAPYSSTPNSASSTIDPRYPLVALNATSSALFLYCLWKLAPDRLSLYLDSTIPRPSSAFTIYLYSSFLLALELKDNIFLANLVSVILKDGHAGEPGDVPITWVYENTGPGHLLRQFVVDCTLAWADEEVGKYRKMASRAPREFVVDVSCRLLELGGRVWLKSDVGTKYTYGGGWPVDE